VSKLSVELEPKAAAGRRIEVIRGGGGRRHWSRDEKARAVEASLVPGVVISEVARRHGLTPQQLFVWRREARIKSIPAATEPLFVPAIAGREEEGAAASPTRLETTRPHTIELDVAGSSVFIWAGADPTLVVTIIGALKAAK
jgi:transposase